jgi:hypothetical protein
VVAGINKILNKTNNMYPIFSKSKTASFKVFCLTFFLLMAFKGTSYGQCISLVAGTGTAGFSGDGGLATAAKLNAQRGIYIDATGNLYIIDEGNQRIRKINTSGIISTIAGTGTAGYSGDGGAATSAKLNLPQYICMDGSGNIYFTEWNNHTIRKINTSGTISTYAGTGAAGYTGDGGLATSAKLKNPAGIYIDAAGNVYFGDSGNDVIRKINTSGIISTVAGTGTGGYSGDGGSATSAKLNTPYQVTVDAAGNIYIGDYSNNRIRKVNTSGTISTIAGTGTAGYTGDGGAATSATLNGPASIIMDGSGNLYFTESGNNVVRKINTSGIISTIAGTGVAGYSGIGGAATSAQLNFGAGGIAIDGSQNIYISETNNNRIRKFAAPLPVLPSLSTSSINASTSGCTDARGYYGFLNPSSTGQQLAAIHPKGNSGGTLSAVVDASRTTYQMKTDGATSTTALMGRMVTVSATIAGPYNTNGGMRVRMYYSTAEQTAAKNALDATITSQGGVVKQWAWFKYEGTAAQVVANQTSGGFTGTYTKWVTPDSSGTDNGINFVEFWNLKSFSTFGGLAYANTTNVLLPVTLVDFSARVQPNCSAVVLDWSTASETNSRDFVIQRSTDGASWTSLGTLPAAGTNDALHSYRYTDHSPIAGLLNLYRLDVNGIDGHHGYSNTASARLRCSEGTCTIYPNPSPKGTVSLRLEGYSQGAGIRITDPLGRLALPEWKDAANGITALSTESLPDGIYGVRITDNATGAIDFQKLVIVR